MPQLDFGVLFILGIGALGGVLGASLFQRLRIPQVVGYIAIGVLIGQSGIRLVRYEDILTLRPFNLFALGLIGFLVGGELRGETLRRHGRQFFYILLCEGLGAFFLVGIVAGLAIWYLFDSVPTAFAAGIIFGAIASATDPASTINVLWEYRARGLVTTTLIAIVALDDALAMALYGIGTSLAQIVTGASSSLSHAIKTVSVHLLGAVILGFVLGILLNYILRWMYQKEKTLAISLATILLAIGIALAADIDIILATMTLGVTLANLAPRRSRELFSLTRSFSNPIYVIFFVLVGARLVVAEMPFWLWGIILLYVAGTTLGKFTGASLGAWLAGAANTVRRYSGLGLFAQGGVAVGLSIMASHHLNGIMLTPYLSLGDAIIFAITATTLIVQLLGPPMTKLAIKLAGEIDKNVTEEDIIAEWKVKDAMDREALVIKEYEPLSRAVQIFSEHENMSYPVVDRDDRILGIITLERLKDVLPDQDTWEWLVAGDVMIPVVEKVYPSTPLKEALDLMRQLKFERLPVVKSARDDRAVGMLDMRSTMWCISEEVIRRQQQGTPAKRSGADGTSPPLPLQ
jgi:Kef-type K+ transport system membrane component KefB/predicted transcriptional regulator